jgi:DNA-binding transcriptional regulator YhcF (GntR family)
MLSDGSTSFIYGPGGQIVEQINTATTTPTYLVHDQLGSTRVLTNQAGTVVGTYSYDAYGNQIATGITRTVTGTVTHVANLVSSPIGFAGGWGSITSCTAGMTRRRRAG